MHTQIAKSQGHVNMLWDTTGHLEFIQGAFTLLFFLWLLVPHFDEPLCLLPVMRDIYSPGFQVILLNLLPSSSMYVGVEEVPTEQLIDLWEYSGKQLSMKWGSYYRLDIQFYLVVQIPTENKSMEKKIKDI